MKRAVVLLAVSACATAAQSARPVLPGKTEVTASLGRAASLEKANPGSVVHNDPYAQGFDEGMWVGELMIRRGIADGLDAGLRLGRTPGAGGISLLAIDPKARLVRGTSSVISIGIPTGITWDETPDVTYRGAFIVPTFYLSMDVSPSMELIAAPKLYLLFERDQDARTAWGITFAARFTEPERHWAVQPELGLTRIDDATFLLLGFSVSAAN